MLIPGPWKQLSTLFNLRGNHMSASVENVNKWAYFAQNIGWLISIPVALTLIYSNLSSRVDAQEKEISALRSTMNDNATATSNRLDAIDRKQGEQLVILTELKTIVEGAPHGQLKTQNNN